MLNLYRDAFASLRAHDVRYVVIGGAAGMLHGVPRMTWDVDILIDPTLDNATRLLNALVEARIGTATLTTPENLLAHEITILRDYVRIDIMTRMMAIEFADAWARRQTRTVEGQPFYILSREDFIATKKAYGRPKDLEDVRALEEGRSPEEPPKH